MASFDTFVELYEGTIQRDDVTFKAGAGVVRLDAGDDLATILNGVRAAYGEDGDDVIVADRAATLSGGSGDDRLTAGADADLLDGGVGNDTIVAVGANTVALAEGDDQLTATAWIGTLEAGIGDDLLDIASAGQVTLGTGDDRMTATGQIAQLDAGDGRDDIVLQAGATSVDLGAGADSFRADGYVGEVSGGQRSDRLTLSGGGTAHGDGGDDILRIGDGGSRNVALYGDDGEDRFVFDLSSAAPETALVDGGSGADTLVINLERGDDLWAQRAEIVAELDGRSVGDDGYHSALLNLDITSIASIEVDL